MSLAEPAVSTPTYGPPCSLFQSVLRNVPKALFSILDGVFVFFGYRRRLGDMLARTVMINSK